MKLNYIFFLTIIFLACSHSINKTESQIVIDENSVDSTPLEKDIEDIADTTIFADAKYTLKWAHIRIKNDTLRTSVGNKISNYKLIIEVFKDDKFVGKTALKKLNFVKNVMPYVRIDGIWYEKYDPKTKAFIFRTVIREPETCNQMRFEFAINQKAKFRLIKELEDSEN